MPNDDWRNLKWSRMETHQKMWFLFMLLLLLLLFIAIGVDSCGIMDIPNWAMLVWAVVSIYTVGKNITNLNLFNDVDSDDDSESSDE